MYPVLFRIGDFEITSFGVLVAVGALVGIWMFGRELKRSGLPADGVDAAVAGVIGGLIGAKLLWTLEFSGEAPITDLLFSRGGSELVWGTDWRRWDRSMDAQASPRSCRSRVGCSDARARRRSCHRADRVLHGWRRLRASKQSALGRRVS